MRTFKLAALLMLVVFASCGDDDNSGTITSVQDNRLTADEVINLLNTTLLDENGGPIGIADGVETNREVAVYGAYEAILTYSSTHEGIEFLVPYQKGQSFSYEYQLRDNRGSISLKSSNEDGCYAEMTVRVPEFSQVTKMRFLDSNAFWNENNSTESLEGLINKQVSAGTSISVLFTQLQQQMAAQQNQEAKDKINAINENQQAQDEAYNVLNECRTQLTVARKSGTSKVSDELLSYFKENSIDYPNVGKGQVYTAEKWETVIAEMEGMLEEFSNDTQRQMEFIQDFMGQYYNYQQGAAISNQTISSLINGK